MPKLLRKDTIDKQSASQAFHSCRDEENSVTQHDNAVYYTPHELTEVTNSNSKRVSLVPPDEDLIFKTELIAELDQRNSVNHRSYRRLDDQASVCTSASEELMKRRLKNRGTLTLQDTKEGKETALFDR